MKPMLAKKWNGEDPTGWYMSEKLDGVRAIWNGWYFESRNEKTFIAPKWFEEDIPSHSVLDGELWMGRGRFNETSGQVRRKTNQDWTGMKYMVFDYVELDETFDTHVGVLRKMILPKHVIPLKQIKCRGIKHLLAFEEQILKGGGEGVMLRHMYSRYALDKRSSFLLKVKKFHDDEAVVVGYEEGEGKHIGRMGTLICMYKGKTIRIGTGFTDIQRTCPPPLQCVVTFKYFEMSKDNHPRFPVYVGRRDYE